MSNRLLVRKIANGHPQGLAPVRRDAGGLGTSWTRIRAAWRRYRSRQHISGLDSHMLKDIGVTYAEAEAEANKPFWRF
jgi:uncharacterized protein YjiS (DUF1127 family)